MEIQTQKKRKKPSDAGVLAFALIQRRDTGAFAFGAVVHSFMHAFFWVCARAESEMVVQSSPLMPGQMKKNGSREGAQA